MLKIWVNGQTRFVVIAFALLMATSLTGCKADSNYFAASNASVGSGDGSSSDANVGFRIRLKAKSGVKGFMHKFGDITAVCEIPPTAINTPTEINCMMNMLEYDLWFYGYEYEVNIPAPIDGTAYCSYLVEEPHRYYTAQAGYGPTSASITNTDGTMTSCTINGVAGTINLALKTCSNAEVTFGSTGTLSSCAYDYSQQDGDVKGPNCCQGKVDVSVTTVTTVGAPPPPTTIASTKIDYGGKVSNCFESANDYISTWPKIPGTSKASGQVIELGSGGLIRSQKLPSVFALAQASTRARTAADFLNAGFHGWAAYVADPATYDATVVVPKSMNPIADLGAAGTHAGVGATALPQAGKGAVVFECLNPAGEIRHRISVYANAWNTIEDFDAFKLNGVAAAVDPGRTGTAGVNCSAINGLGSCNTLWGFDDMINESGLLDCAGDANAYCYPYEGSRGAPP